MTSGKNKKDSLIEKLKEKAVAEQRKSSSEEEGGSNKEELKQRLVKKLEQVLKGGGVK